MLIHVAAVSALMWLLVGTISLAVIEIGIPLDQLSEGDICEALSDGCGHKVMIPPL